MDKEDQTEKMNEPGYKKLLTYKLAQIAFDLGWDFVPQYYNRPEDRRQRDQIYQALRSHKQNIVEGSAERSLSTKLKLYDVAKSSGMESKEDFEDILRMERFPLWNKTDPRLLKLRKVFENYPPSPSYPSTPPFPSVSSVLETGEISGTRGIRRGEKQIEVELISNYMVDILTRCGYLLDHQMNAVEEKHTRDGGYSENLLKRRLEYKKRTSF